MKETRWAIVAAIALCIIGGLLAYLRIRANLKTKLEPGESVWRLTYHVVLHDTQMGTRVQATLPYSTPRGRIFQERFVRAGLMMDIVRNKQTRGREAIAVALGRERGVRFIAEFDIRLRTKKKATHAAIKLPTETRAKYLKAEKLVQSKDPAIKKIVESLTQEQISQEELVRRIFEYCSEEITKGDEYAPKSSTKVIQKGVGSTQGIARTMVALCRASQIPARLVTGFIIEEGEKTFPHTWLQVYEDKQWLPFDPKYGYERELPANYLPVCYNNVQIVKITESDNWQYKFSIVRLEDFPDSALAQKKRPLSIADLTRLEAGMQTALATLLLLPVAAFITMLFRNVIGIQTFGTFTPALFALSFVYADLRTGLMTLLLVLIMGLAIRGALQSFKLLIIARLSILLVIVVVCVIIAVSILDYLGLTPSSEAVILPIVILTMLIERFYITVEEDGTRHALQLALGTLLVASCCYVVINWEGLARLVLTYPEVQCFVIASMLLLGRYAGYRLTELVRFKDFGEEEEEQDGEKK